MSDQLKKASEVPFEGSRQSCGNVLCRMFHISKGIVNEGGLAETYKKSLSRYLHTIASMIKNKTAGHETFIDVAKALKGKDISNMETVAQTLFTLHQKTESNKPKENPNPFDNLTL